MNEVQTAILISLLTIIFIVLLTSYITYAITFRRRARPLDIERDLGIDLQEYKDIEKYAKEFEAVPFEEVKIRTHDGLELVGRYYHYVDGAPLDIMFHGYRSSPTHDFCGGALTSKEAGHNILLIYQRAHGLSRGRAITFGCKESLDALEWVKYANNRFGNDIPITLIGVSMGASTVIAASALQMPDNVIGVIADCPFSSAKDIIKNTVRSMKLPVAVFYPFIRLGALLFAGFDPDRTVAKEAVRNAKLPILLIHGEDDSFVPKYMSDEIYAAHTGIMHYHTFPGANHGLASLTDPERYKKICKEFVEMCMERKNKKHD